MYGNSSNIIDTGEVFNLSSLKEGYYKLSYLIPPNSIGVFTGRDFDIAYANYILGNDTVFVQFFNIIINLYYGKDVYIITSPEDWSENLIESLLKLIQQRYGYNGAYIGSKEDYYALLNSNTRFEFEKGFGLLNLDQDKERYAILIQIINNRMNPPAYGGDE